MSRPNLAGYLNIAVGEPLAAVGATFEAAFEHRRESFLVVRVSGLPEGFSEETEAEILRTVLEAIYAFLKDRGMNTVVFEVERTCLSREAGFFHIYFSYYEKRGKKDDLH